MCGHGCAGEACISAIGEVPVGRWGRGPAVARPGPVGLRQTCAWIEWLQLVWMGVLVAGVSLDCVSVGVASRPAWLPVVFRILPALADHRAGVLGGSCDALTGCCRSCRPACSSWATPELRGNTKRELGFVPAHARARPARVAGSGVPGNG